MCVPLSNAEIVWHAPHHGCLVLASLDGLTALYDRRSGQTHLLDAASIEILAALGALPTTSARLADLLAIDFDLAAEGDPAAVIDARLAELAALGLVEAV